MSKETIRQIWTWGYRPFVMGGKVHYVLACKIKCTGPHDLGKGYKGYVATAPSGDTVVAEATTGAIVGSSLRQVRKDIETGDPAVMRQQVKQAAIDMMNAEVTDVKNFWEKTKKSLPG
jgi:hypothetical protein